MQGKDTGAGAGATRTKRKGERHMALKNIIKVEDPEEIKTGYAGLVMEAVKLASLIASFAGFAMGFVLKGRLAADVATQGLGSLAFTFGLLFIVLFLGLWFPVREIPMLVREKDRHPKAKNVPDGRIVAMILGQYAFSFGFCFLFAVGVDATTAVMNPLIAGDYLLDYPAAVFFFYAAAPSVIVNVIFMGFMRREIGRLPRD